MATYRSSRLTEIKLNHTAVLLEQADQALRARHYSRLTSRSYLGWIRRFARFHARRDLLDLGETEISAFLTHLAIDLDVTPLTQNQALSAILFLYSECSAVTSIV